MKGVKWPQLKREAEAIELPSPADLISTEGTSAEG